MAAFEYSTLNPLSATEWDNSELIKARNACNQEIESIHAARQEIEESLQALTRSDIASLDFDVIEAQRNKFQRDRLHLLQRELKFRNGLLKEFMKLEKEVAKEAGREWTAELGGMEAKIVEGLEKLGYLPCGKNPGFGTWEPGMIQRHVAVRELVYKIDSARRHVSNYDDVRQNNEVAAQLQATLAKALTTLVG